MIGRLVLALIAAALVAGAVPLPAPSQRDAWRQDYRRPSEIPFPDDNPYSEAKARLGRILFFDPLLSGSHTRSCATCHNPGLSWADGLPKAIGEQQRRLPFRSPTLLNIAWVPLLGWEGKFPDLEAVAFGPITGAGNMNNREADLLAALAAIPGYRLAFAAAFGGGAVSRRNVELALATFERTIVSGQSRFDRWVEGEEAALTEAEKRGFDLFNRKAGCAECHRGWNFTDAAFYDIGTGADEPGRARLIANSPKLRHAFKVPTLRDVGRRAPYMHDGSVADLRQVIELYDRGGVDRPSRSELIKPLGLSAGEKDDLIAFLGSLTAEAPAVTVPALPR